MADLLPPRLLVFFIYIHQRLRSFDAIPNDVARCNCLNNHCVMQNVSHVFTDGNDFIQVITQIWALLLAGLGLGALLDVWVSLQLTDLEYQQVEKENALLCFLNFFCYILQAGHDFPIIFYLAVGGSLLSYIYSAPPLKVFDTSVLNHTIPLVFSTVHHNQSTAFD